jgi:predicted TPR repeat methyltransferase
MSPSLIGLSSSGDVALDRRYRWAEAELGAGDASAAADILAQTLERAPDWTPAWVLLGRAHAEAGEREAAVEAFRRALALDPQDRLGAGLELVRLGALAEAQGMATGYVRALFDDYADRFDAHLTGPLAYRGPDLIMAAIDRVAGPGRRFGLTLDAGCGTGLMAELLRPCAERLEGCDLSARMLARAAARGLYDALVQADLVSWLANQPGQAADLVVAADVFVYLGDLTPALASAAAALRPGGLCAFSVQAHKGTGFRLGEDKRFHHSRAHVAQAAASVGFTVRRVGEASTRRDAGLPVPGLVCVLAR